MSILIHSSMWLDSRNHVGNRFPGSGKGKPYCLLRSKECPSSLTVEAGRESINLGSLKLAGQLDFKVTVNSTLRGGRGGFPENPRGMSWRHAVLRLVRLALFDVVGGRLNRL